ncbi:hypothetical protein BV25DRAFT_1993101 [Artomyces pyxidatus]|uniref:Uncharacterized protein n=1 Tax=Artomyces pyxidatus TaxID=48021 RepID=A0ACB8SU87_9AGAM|nr:hypothetical protein BV25DRAFT_1993101 [Artomyces pyxidatus]
MAQTAIDFWGSVVRARMPMIDHFTHYDSAVSTGATWEVLDQEIRAIFDIAWLLKTRRNALASRIVRLPADILSSIFLWVKEMDPFYHDRPEVTMKIPGWISLTHVCHRWREVALHDSVLWGECILLDRLPPSWGAEILRRSGSTPLSMRANFSLAPALEDAFDRNVVSRLRTLYLLGRERETQHTLHRLQDVLQAPAPLLRTLSIRHTMPLVLPHLFCNKTPNLSHVYLDNCFIPWESSLLANLTCLHITFTIQGVYTHLMPSPQRMSEVLRHMPGLRTLNISRLLLPIMQQDLVDAQRTSECIIELPELAFLSLVGDIYSCADLILRLSFPSTLRPTLIFEYNADILPIPSVLEKLGGFSRPSRSLAIQCDSLIKTAIHLSAVRWDVRSLPQSPTKDTTSLVFSGRLSLVSQAVLSVLFWNPWQELSFHQLQDVYVRLTEQQALEERPWSKERWIGMFGSAREVRSLRVDGWACMPGLLEAMTPPSDAVLSDSFLFPNLDNFTLYRYITPHDRRWFLQELSPASVVPLPFEVQDCIKIALQTCMRARSARGVRLRSLEVDPDFMISPRDEFGVDTVTVKRCMLGCADVATSVFFS